MEPELEDIYMQGLISFLEIFLREQADTFTHSSAESFDVSLQVVAPLGVRFGYGTLMSFSICLASV